MMSIQIGNSLRRKQQRVLGQQWLHPKGRRPDAAVYYIQAPWRYLVALAVKGRVRHPLQIVQAVEAIPIAPRRSRVLSDRRLGEQVEHLRHDGGEAAPVQISQQV